MPQASIPTSLRPGLFLPFKYWDSMLGLHSEKNSTAKEKCENHWTGSKIPKPGCSTELLKELFQIMNSWASRPSEIITSQRILVQHPKASPQCLRGTDP